MAAPPIFWVANFREHHRGLEGLQQPFQQKSCHHRFAAADMEIEIMHAGFHLLLDLANDSSGPTGDQLGLDAETLPECLFNFLSQLGAGGHRNDDPCLLLACFDNSLPFSWPCGSALSQCHLPLKIPS